MRCSAPSSDMHSFAMMPWLAPVNTSRVFTLQSVNGRIRYVRAVASYAGHLAPFRFTRRPLGELDIRIQIAYCGICHTDLHQIRNDWRNSTFPMVPGCALTVWTRNKTLLILRLSKICISAAFSS